MGTPFVLRTVHYRLLAGLWTIGLLLAMSLPTGSMPKVQSPLGLDKIVHTVLFVGFGLLWLRGLCPPTRNGLSSRFPWRSFLFLSVGVLFAGATEVYQEVSSVKRVASPYDFGADLIGLFVAFAGYYVYHQHLSRRASSERRAG